MRYTITIACLLCLVTASTSSAEKGSDPPLVVELDWFTIDSGAPSVSTQGDFELMGSIGQNDTGVIAAGDFIIAGGFLPANDQTLIWLDSEPELSVSEAEESIRIPISIQRVNAVPAYLGYRLESGSASAPDDYTDQSGRLSIMWYQYDAAIEISLVDDGFNEQTESFHLILEDPVNCSIVGPDSITINIVDGPILQLSQTELEFPDHSTSPGPSVPEYITVSNVGNSPLNFVGSGFNMTGNHYTEFCLQYFGDKYEVLTPSDIVFTGLQFMSPDTSTLPPGESRDVVVVFNPFTTGDKYASLQFLTDSSLEPTRTILLSGNAVSNGGVAKSTDCETVIDDLQIERDSWFPFGVNTDSLAHPRFSNNGNILTISREPYFSSQQFGYWHTNESPGFFPRCDTEDEVILAKWSLSTEGILETTDGTDIPGYRLRMSAPTALINSLIHIENATPRPAPASPITPINDTRDFSTFLTFPHGSIDPASFDYIFNFDFLSTRYSDSDDAKIQLERLETRRFSKSNFDARFSSIPLFEWNFEQPHDWMEGDTTYIGRPGVVPQSVYQADMTNGLSAEYHLPDGGSDVFSWFNSPNLQRSLFLPDRLYKFKAVVSATCENCQICAECSDKTPVPQFRIRLGSGTSGPDYNYAYMHVVDDNTSGMNTHVVHGGGLVTIEDYFEVPMDWEPNAVMIFFDIILGTMEHPSNDGTMTLHSLSIHEQEQIEGSFDLVYPQDNSVEVSLFPDFSFEQLHNLLEFDDQLLVDSYELHLSPDPSFGDVEILEISNKPGDGSANILFSYPHLLDPETVYYWKVKAIDVSGQYIWSDSVFSFQTEDDGNLPVPAPPIFREGYTNFLQICLYWTQVEVPGYRVGYDILRGTSTGGPYTKLNDSPLEVPSYCDYDIDLDDQHYYYVVRSILLDRSRSILKQSPNSEEDDYPLSECDELRSEYLEDLFEPEIPSGIVTPIPDSVFAENVLGQPLQQPADPGICDPLLSQVPVWRNLSPDSGSLNLPSNNDLFDVILDVEYDQVPWEAPDNPSPCNREMQLLTWQEGVPHYTEQGKILVCETTWLFPGVTEIMDVEDSNGPRLRDPFYSVCRGEIRFKQGIPPVQSAYDINMMLSHSGAPGHDFDIWLPENVADNYLSDLDYFFPPSDSKRIRIGGERYKNV